MKHRKREDFFLDSQLRRRFLWLAVDGNHENFARLFGGEFSVVEIFGGKAYKIREHVYYLKRGEVFTIDEKSFFALGGAMSHDKEPGIVMNAYGKSHHWPGRAEEIDWWPEEVPSPKDMENAHRNLDRVDWKVDHVLTHTCPESQRPLFCEESRPVDATEVMLQNLMDRRLEFKTWQFGHFHTEMRIGRFICHYDKVRPHTEALLET